MPSFTPDPERRQQLDRFWRMILLASEVPLPIPVPASFDDVLPVQRLQDDEEPSVDEGGTA